MVKTCAFLAAGAAAFQSAAPVSRPLTRVDGTLVEEFKFKKHFNRFTFKDFHKCIEAAGMTDEFSAADITVIAPTDAAFEELGKAGFDEILADQALLKNMLNYAILKEDMDGDSIRGDSADGGATAPKTVATVHGNDLVVDSDGKVAYLNEAKLLTFDVMADNGRFHIVDWVNIPK